MSWLTNLEQNIQFVAFWAHLGMTALFVEHMPGREPYWGDLWLALALLFWLVKEYYFDARDEHNPPQTFWMNTQDFTGGAFGAILGYALRA